MLSLELTPVACLVAVAALLCWPRRTAAGRLRGVAVAGPAARWRAGARRRPGPVATVAAGAAAGALAGGLVAGIGGAVGFALVAATAVWRLRSRHDEAAGLAALADLVATFGLLTAELRAGAHPALAAQRVVGGTGPAVTTVLGAIADAGRLSGDVPAALRAAAARSGVPALVEPLGRLATAWRLSERHGVGLAEVLDAARRDLDHRVRAARRLAATLAGPRASAVVLAALPPFGLMLGQAVGAAPWRVLAGTGLGQALLVAGCALTCLGLGWSARITSKAAAP